MVDAVVAGAGSVSSRTRCAGSVTASPAGYVELYADSDSVLVEAVSVGPDAVDWMAEITLATGHRFGSRRVRRSSMLSRPAVGR